MNILLGTACDLVDRGGVTVVVRTLGVQFRRNGNAVAYLSPYETENSPREVDDIPYYHFRLRPWSEKRRPLRGRLAWFLFFPITCWRLAQFLRRERIEIVNLHYFSDCWSYFFLLRLFMRFQLVISVHGSDVLGVEGKRNRRLLERWHRALDRIVFCSDGFRRDVLAEKSSLWPKSVTILNGIALNDLEKVPLSPRKRRAIVCVAHLREHKAQDDLLRAMKLLAVEFPDVELDLVGEGPFRPRLEALARELGLEARVHFRGDIPREESLSTVASATIFCSPSRREPCGIAIIEAMGLGVPMVATRVHGTPELIRTGKEGLVVEPDQPEALARALSHLLRDETLRRTLASNGFHRAKEALNVERFFSDYRRLFELLLSRPPHGEDMPEARQQGERGESDSSAKTLPSVSKFGVPADL